MFETFALSMQELAAVALLVYAGAGTIYAMLRERSGHILLQGVQRREFPIRQFKSARAL